MRKENMMEIYLCVLNVHFSVTLNQEFIPTKCQSMKDGDTGVIFVTSHPSQNKQLKGIFNPSMQGSLICVISAPIKIM